MFDVEEVVRKVGLMDGLDLKDALFNEKPDVIKRPPRLRRHPSSYDRFYGEIIDEMNLARTNPAAYADKVARILPEFQGRDRVHYEDNVKIILRTKEGSACVRECIAFMKRQQPVAPIEKDMPAGMAHAALDHVKDQGPRGTTGHDGSDGSTPFQRMERYGSWRVTAAENIHYGRISGDKTAEDIVMSLMVDDGVRGRGHRDNILNPRLRVVGIAMGKHKRYGEMCVIDFAGAYGEKTAAPRPRIKSHGGVPAKRRSVWDAEEVQKRVGQMGRSIFNGEKNDVDTNIVVKPPRLRRQPSSFDQYYEGIIDEMNLARTNPQAYARKVAKILPEFNGKHRVQYDENGTKCVLLTNEGPRCVRECIAFMERQSPVPPLSYDMPKGMCRAAMDHVKDQGARGTTGHDGGDGSTPFDRMGRYGQWLVTAGENLHYGRTHGDKTAEDIVMGLIVDDGVPDRGHRDNILNPKFKVVGVAMGKHNSAYGCMCAIEYAGGYTKKIEGSGTIVSKQHISKDLEAMLALIPSPRFKTFAAEELEKHPDATLTLEYTPKSAKLVVQSGFGSGTLSMRFG